MSEKLCVERDRRKIKHWRSQEIRKIGEKVRKINKERKCVEADKAKHIRQNDGEQAKETVSSQATWNGKEKSIESFLLKIKEESEQIETISLTSKK